MRPGAIKQRDVAPVQTFAKAAAKCSAEVSWRSCLDPRHPVSCLCSRPRLTFALALQARIYGQCVTANYENIERNMCSKEFLAFKACVQQKVSVRSGRDPVRKAFAD